MAFQYKISSCGCDCNCQTLYVKDITGIYNSTTNPTGWGTPNPSYTAVVSAVATVTLSTGTIITVDLTSYYSSITNLGQNMTLIDWTSTENTIPDGETKIEVVIIGINQDSEGYTTNAVIYKWLTCNVQNCFNQKMGDINLEDCGCNNEKNEKLTENYMYMIASGYAYQCGNLKKANALLKQATDYCNGDCTTC